MSSRTVRTARAAITSAIAIALATAAAAPAFAATNMYLELGPIKGEAADRSAARGKVELSSFTFSATRKGWDGTIKGNPKVADDSADAATGQKRQHGWNTVSKPLDRGSVTVMGNLPGCTVGAAYADAVLQTPTERFEFKDAIITSCTMSGSTGGDDRPTESISMSGSTGGDDRPTESISMNYDKIVTVYAPQSKDKAKVDVKGWDPEKKEE